MHRERLEKMVELLRKIDPKDFDLSVWIWDCGTVGCAVGHACMSPWFKNEGLSIEPTLGANPTPRYENHSGWSAVSLFFEISAQEAKYLFRHYEYPNQQHTRAFEVAHRIQTFLATGD